MPDSTTNPQDSFLERMQRDPSPKSDLTSKIIRFSLRKILASRLFARSSQQSRFLRFTVEETLAGRGPDLEQYVIGLRVFDRRDSFDPQSDPIVRIGAMRLRAKLNAYYETEGREDSIIIEFPRGYMPVFRCRQKTPEKPKSPWFRLRRAIGAMKRTWRLCFRLKEPGSFGG
jgi:hypothetical protein